MFSNKIINLEKIFGIVFSIRFKLYLIENVLLDEEIATARFSCDLAKCKGACCTFPGDFGAPLYEEEISEMSNCLSAASVYLSDLSKKIIAEKGFYEITNGSLTTVCIDRKDCVFVYYDGNVAKCSLERAYFDRATNFRKPLSCHLFPLREGNFNGKYLYYEKISECKPGIKKGMNDRISLVTALKEPLTRAYGENWYNKLISFINNGIR